MTMTTKIVEPEPTDFESYIISEKIWHDFVDLYNLTLIVKRQWYSILLRSWLKWTVSTL